MGKEKDPPGRGGMVQILRAYTIFNFEKKNLLVEKLQKQYREFSYSLHQLHLMLLCDLTAMI